jgi:hypothetical protein
LYSTVDHGRRAKAILLFLTFKSLNWDSDPQEANADAKQNGHNFSVIPTKFAKIFQKLGLGFGSARRECGRETKWTQFCGYSKEIRQNLCRK